MIPIDLLARPITDLIGIFGSGVTPSGGPSDALRTASSTLEMVHSTGRSGIAGIYGEWSGTGGTAAIVKTEEAQRSTNRISDRGNEIAAVVDEAAEIVNKGMRELEGILQSFLSFAASAAPVLFSPAGIAMLISSALEHLNQATAVVTRVRAELEQHTAKMAGLNPEDTPEKPSGGAPASTAAASATSAASAGQATATKAASAVASNASGLASSLFSPSSISGGSRGSDSTGATNASRSQQTGKSTGEGVEIVLPDGSTTVAPNQAAADAVRNALTQQGVPYVWGGTSPGQGLDCSGLTQWAYGEAGVGIPRLAQEQNVGTSIAAGDVMAGDLLVWDGHVAMALGNGQLVEAGDPVQVGPMRTTNSGMAFMGYYRPTE
ncbi:MAG: C40 family peptidase [Rhodococcus sp.]|nr:C40 family peptidase [Rhodococcus sp. (in: high G+C Gram-positive bacteria)]